MTPRSQSHTNRASPTNSYPNNNNRPSTPLRKYFSRRHLGKSIPQLSKADDYIGFASPWAVLWFTVRLVVPFAYCVIGWNILTLLFRDTATSAMRQERSYTRVFIETWCWLEALCYIFMKLHIKWLQMKDPLEASLSSAPLMSTSDRATLWKRMMEDVAVDPVSFLSGWFFDEDIHEISNYDIRDFIAWSMFEGRNQEHLTAEELDQLEDFLAEAEYRLSLHLYGARLDGDDEVEEYDSEDATECVDGAVDGEEEPEWRKTLPLPKKSKYRDSIWLFHLLRFYECVFSSPNV